MGNIPPKVVKIETTLRLAAQHGTVAVSRNARMVQVAILADTDTMAAAITAELAARLHEGRMSLLVETYTAAHDVVVVMGKDGITMLKATVDGVAAQRMARPGATVAVKQEGGHG
jgi:hypothetical protein